MLYEQLKPPPSGEAQFVLTILKSPGLVPVRVAGVNVRFPVPELVNVAVRLAVALTATVPKFRGDGLNETTGTPPELNT